MFTPETRTTRPHCQHAIALIACLASTAAHAQAPTRGTSTALAHSMYGTPDPTPITPMPLVAPVFLQTDQIDSSITGRQLRYLGSPG